MRGDETDGRHRGEIVRKRPSESYRKGDGERERARERGQGSHTHS
jgi:hypothetical protein